MYRLAAMLRIPSAEPFDGTDEEALRILKNCRRVMKKPTHAC